jgi:hypothetical protein
MRQLDGVTSSYVSEIENGHEIPSDRVLGIYVKLGGDRGQLMELAAKARRASLQVDAAADGTLDKLLGDPHADPHVLRRGYEVGHTMDTAYIGPNWVVTKVTHQAVIRPTSPSTRFFVFRDVYEEDPRPGVTTITAASGCELAYHEVSPQGLLYGVLKITGRADEAGDHHLSWVIAVDSTQPTTPRVAAMALTPLAHTTQQVQFAEPALPTALWWFRDFDPNGFRKPPPQERLIPTNAAAWYSHDFYDLKKATAGIAWTP